MLLQAFAELDLDTDLMSTRLKHTLSCRRVLPSLHELSNAYLD